MEALSSKSAPGMGYVTSSFGLSPKAGHSIFLLIKQAQSSKIEDKET